MKNPLKDREDMGTQLLFPTLSWSSMNAFESYDREKWYKNYVLGLRDEPNEVMKVGIEVGEKLATDKTYLPEVTRYDVMEQELRGIFDGISLRGHIDTFDSKTKSFGEYKTSFSKERWTQKIAEEHGQLLFYYFLIYLNFKVRPEQIKCHLYFIHCEEQGNFSYKIGNIQTFEVKKTLADVLNFAVRIKKTYAEMELYIKNKKSII